MNLTQAYTDATGTKHEAAYFVPVSALLSYPNNTVIVNYQVFASEEAYNLGLQPVSTSIRPGPGNRRGPNGEQAAPEISNTNRVKFDAASHPEMISSVKAAIESACQAPAAAEFERLVALTDQQIADAKTAMAAKAKG